MGTARCAFRVRGSASDAVMTALQEGLKAEVGPASTAVHGWLPDQATSRPSDSRLISSW
jgi:hypothetical protein